MIFFRGTDGALVASSITGENGVMVVLDPDTLWEEVKRLQRELAEEMNELKDRRQVAVDICGTSLEEWARTKPHSRKEEETVARRHRMVMAVHSEFNRRIQKYRLDQHRRLDDVQLFLAAEGEARAKMATKIHLELSRCLDVEVHLFRKIVGKFEHSVRRLAEASNARS
ncbi:MAG TPA: hypothetical protein VNE42_07965 [Acidimicrobiales bacterium]|nr:hypothetical protein [Acidimicrobiales bacterium]